MIDTRSDASTPKNATSQPASTQTGDRKNGRKASRFGTGFSLDKLVKAGVALAAVTQAPGALAAGGRGLMQATPPPGATFGATPGVALAPPPTPGATPVVVRNPPRPGSVPPQGSVPAAPAASPPPTPVATVTPSNPPPAPVSTPMASNPPASPAAVPPPAPPGSGNTTVAAAVFSSTLRPFPASATVNTFNIDNRASFQAVTNMGLLHDTVSIPFRECMECDSTHHLKTPPTAKDYYAYPAAAPAGFTFKAVDWLLNLFNEGIDNRLPAQADVQSSYFLGAAGFDATNKALVSIFAPNSNRRIADATGSDTTTGMSYALFRFCDLNKNQSWIGVTSELPLDANGTSYVGLGTKDPFGRIAAWPGMRQKAYSKFLMSHPEMVQDPTQTGLNNIVGSDPTFPMRAMTCSDVTPYNAHAPVSAVNPEPDFNGIFEQVFNLLQSRSKFAILTTIGANEWTRDAATIDAGISQATFYYGGALRQVPLNNFGPVLDYLSPAGGNTMVIPNHAYVLQTEGRIGDKTISLLNPWGFNPTTSSNLDGSVIGDKILGGADLMWAVGRNLYIGDLYT